MVKKNDKWLLISFIIYILTFVIIAVCGISGVFAATYQMNYNYEQRYYDNFGSSVVQVPTSWMDSFGSYVSNEITTYANSYGAGLSITSPIPLLSGHTYSFSVYFEGIFNIALSSKNEISIASSLGAAANDYANNIPGTELLYSKVSNNSILQFVFKADNNHTHLFFPWTTTSTTTQSYVVTEIVMEDLGSSGVSEQDINNSLNNQTNEINNSIENSTNTITGSINETENNINQNIDDMEQSIVDSNKETQDVIKDQFNSCRDSNNLFNATLINSNSGIIVNENGSKITLPKVSSGNGFTDTHTKLSVLAPELKVGDVVYLNFNTTSSYNNFIYIVTPQLVWYNGTSITITQEMLNSKVGFYGNRFTNGEDYQVVITDLIMSYKNTTFEPYGEICSNKLDEQNETIKGGFSSIGNWFKELGDKIGSFFDNLLNGILDGLKDLFIPKDGYFEDWFNTLKVFFEEKLGFLATPFTIIIDFVNRYLNLDSGADIIINIPDITVPNFENFTIIKATQFNWSQLLKSKDSFNMLWQLYLSFVDVFLILNFINLCENKYNRIFGGDTTQYEYYTVEDSYTVDDKTGEVKNHRHNQRTTTRKKVN